MNTTETDQELLIRQLANRELWLKFFECLFALLLVLFAFLGNLLVCWAVRRNPSLRTIPNYYIISLAVSDMLMASIGMPLTFVTIIAGEWVFGDALCQYQGFIGSVLATASLLTIASTAVNRYFKIARTPLYHKIYTKALTLKSVLAVWSVSLLLPVPYLATGHRYVYHPGKAMCFFDLENSSPYYALFTIFIFVLLPFCVIFCCYYKVFVAVRSHNKKLQTSHAHNTTGTPSKCFSVSEMRLTKMLFVILLGFITCWCPFVIIDVVGVVQGPFSLPRGVYCLYTFSAGMASCVNPLIYPVMNADFRQEFKAMLTLHCGRIREVASRLRSHAKVAVSNNGSSEEPAGTAACYVISNRNTVQ